MYGKFAVLILRSTKNVNLADGDGQTLDKLKEGHHAAQQELAYSPQQ